MARDEVQSSDGVIILLDIMELKKDERGFHVPKEFETYISNEKTVVLINKVDLVETNEESSLQLWNGENLIKC